MKKVQSKSENSPNLVRPNRHKKAALLTQELDGVEKIRRAAEGHAERARVNGFIRLGYLPHIFAQDKQYSDALLERLWKYFECDRVPPARCSKSKYEMWFWIFNRWSGIPDNLWNRCSPISHLPLYDSETTILKKERYGGRSDTDIVMLEDLKKVIEKIGKSLNIVFPLPTQLFPVTPEVEDALSFKHSEDFRSVSYLGKKYILTSVQAQVIEILHEAWKKGFPDVSTNYILVKKLDRPFSRLRDIFKSNPSVWKDLIKSDRKGTVRLNI